MWRRRMCVDTHHAANSPAAGAPTSFLSELRFAAVFALPARVTCAAAKKPPSLVLIAHTVFISTAGTFKKKKKKASSYISFFFKKKCPYFSLLTTSALALQFTLVICNLCRGCLYLGRSSQTEGDSQRQQGRPRKSKDKRRNELSRTVIVEGLIHQLVKPKHFDWTGRHPPVLWVQ